MNILHRDGSCRIPFWLLPNEMQILYQFSDQEARSAMKDEADQLREYNLAHTAALTTIQQNEQAEQAERARLETENRKKMIRELKANISRTAKTIRLMKNQIRIETTKKMSRAPQMRQELEDLEHTMREQQASLLRLQAMP